MSEPLTLPPCRVCGGTATGIHYGVNTCEACKAFFRRSLVENNKYVCPRDGDCKIINHKRANCSACRLKKCLELGMSKKAVRHGRYTVAIRTKTILEVKQLEREQALKDSFALADSFAKKLPEIISVPKSNPVPDSSVNESIISSIIESSDNSPPLLESTNFTSNDTLQSSVIGSSLMSVSDSLQSTIGEIPENMTSLEPSSVFSSIETNKIFTDMNGLDILNTIDLDITNENIEISGSDVFLNELNSQTVDIDLTSDKIDFLEMNPDELIDLTQEVVDVFASQTTTTAEIPQQQSPQSIASSPSSVQQYSPDTTTLDESMSSQFGSPSTSSIELVSNASSSPSQKNPRSSFELEDYHMTPRPQKKLRASFNLADDMEQLQLINTMVSAQEILYPEMRKYFNKEYTEVIHREFWEKTQLQNELFGQLKSLSTTEYNNFFLVTGIDIDGRRGMFTKVAECMQKEIVKYISFVKSIPGWEDIHNSDKLTLIKASRFEYWLLGKFLSINPDMKFTADEKCGYTHTQVEQMWGSPENIETVNNFTRKLKKLDLTFEEIALLRGVIVLSRDRCALREPELVEKMQWKILQSFIHLVKKTHPNEQLRFARCMDKLTQLRELTEVNYKANKNLENFQKSLIQNYPLLYECLTYEG
ncbi:NR1F2 [Mytilus coruscus]|uniref:NR1F2 n=1 Tax=Mytilus coruscus TaxID=42192 RepID=A0A6J8B0E1_MYTCO|nr:NR1F2 [Mytilus coruscus]